MCQVLFRMLEKKMPMKRMKPLSWISNSTERQKTNRKQFFKNYQAERKVLQRRKDGKCFGLREELMQGRNGLASIRKSKDRCSRNEVIRE